MSAQRHRPDLTPDDSALVEMIEQAPVVPPIKPRIHRSCRDCSAPFTIPAEYVSKTSKWYSLCPSCLHNEI